MRLVAILLIVLMLPSQVLAQPSPDPEIEKPAPLVTLPPGDDRIAPVRKGQPAPFDGQLFGIDTAIRWGFWLQQYKYRLEADSRMLQERCRVETAYRDEALEIEKDRNEKVEGDLRDRLLRSEKARLAAEEEARNPPWYTTWTFGVAVGVVATAVIFGVAVAAVDSTGP